MEFQLPILSETLYRFLKKTWMKFYLVNSSRRIIILQTDIMWEMIVTAVIIFCLQFI